MRIDAVRAACVSLPMTPPMRTAIHETTHTENVLVEIAAAGLRGQGAALTLKPHQALAVRAALVDLVDELRGQDADAVRALWERMSRRLNLTGRTGIGVLALSAIDTALWDLLAQQAGMPLHRLLGTAHAQLPMYVQPGWLSYSVAQLVDEAVAYAEQGYRYYKMRVGSADLRRDLDRVERVKAAVGTGVRVMVDANQGWSRLEGLAAARALDDLGLYWIEEPIDADDVVGYARIADAVSTPIAAGETVFGAAGMQPLIDQGAAAVLMPDLQHCGGPTGFMKVATQADLAGLQISNHLFTQVSIHLLAACRNALIVEHMPGWWDQLFDRPLDVRLGMLRPPDEPGIGYRFDSGPAAQLRDV